MPRILRRPGSLATSATAARRFEITHLPFHSSVPIRHFLFHWPVPYCVFPIPDSETRAKSAATVHDPRRNSFNEPQKNRQPHAFRRADRFTSRRSYTWNGRRVTRGTPPGRRSDRDRRSDKARPRFVSRGRGTRACTEHP